MPKSADEFPAWIDRITARSDADSRPLLAADLARLAALSLEDPRPTRSHFTYVRGRGSTTSEAHLTVDYYAAGVGSFDAYSAAALEAAVSPDPSAVYAQRAAVGTLAGQRAVVVQDFIIESPHAPEGNLQERYLAALFPTDLDLLIELQLSSPDLSLFGDIVEYGNGIASSLRWGARS